MKVVMGPAPCIRCGRPVVFAEYVNRHGITVRAICDPQGPAHRCHPLTFTSTLAYSKDMNNTTERDDYEDGPGNSSTCEDPGMPGHLTCTADKPCVPATFVMTTEARLAARDRIRANKAARLAAAR